MFKANNSQLQAISITLVYLFLFANLKENDFGYLLVQWEGKKSIFFHFEHKKKDSSIPVSFILTFKSLKYKFMSLNISRPHSLFVLTFLNSNEL